ncbi:MAG TPA: protein-disulfide reductase DsbD domain-containing protein [Candidatus Kapabacteria bacterium]|nr:protein-disulfide reductase DsbD domain-containing protein [Candidatus Kapabacteria bacterium]
MKTVIIAVFVFAVSAHAQMYQGKQVSNISLVSGAVKPGKPFTLGIHILMESGWHTYWKTPGDAGAAPVAEIIGAPDLTAGELRYPTPHKMISSDIVTYGYDEEVVFLLPVRPNNANAPHRFKLKLNWLVCKEVCLPAEAILEFNIDSLNADSIKENQRLLDRWTARLPQPGAGFNLDHAGALATVTKDSAINLFVKFFDVAPNTITDFFPIDQEDFVINYNSIAATRDGISMTLTPGRKGAELKQIAGVVLIGTTGYEVNVPVTKQ